MKPDRLQTDTSDPAFCPISHMFSQISKLDMEHSDIDTYLISRF
ncbi:hypothetical protein Zm00014a_014335 [Zea mays]|uniref:Uncharacterized protein n=1 Tax=Zea mays TaxID=4577 RepID=A0A3L6DBE7_MAIZE|nr:hypothetical protein Zm00014a_014335 [Zea mays]